MLKKLALGSAAVAAFAGLGLATPAYAGNENEFNISEQSGNVIVCGNKAIGDITVVLLNLNPVVSSDRQPLDCGIRAQQDQD